MAAGMAAALAARKKMSKSASGDLAEEEPEGQIWHMVFFKIRQQKMEETISLSTKHTTVPRMAWHFTFILLLNWCILRMKPVTALSQTYPGIRKYFENMVAPVSTHFGDDFNWPAISTVDDTVVWQEAAVKGLLSHKSYGGLDEMRQDDERFMFLRVHRLINSMVLVQKRVKPTDCSYQKMRPLYKNCFEGLDQGVELTSGTYTLLNGVEVPYSEDFGGFAVPLPLNWTAAEETINELKEGRFWDRATRRASLLFAMHNSPGHFTGNVELYFTVSPFGEVKPWFNAQFLRMKPYSSLVGGTYVMLLQGVALIFWAVAFVHLVVRCYNQPHPRWRVAMLFHPWTVLEIVSHAMIFGAIFIWIKYLLNPKRTSMDFESTEYQSIMSLAIDFNQVIFLMVAALILWTVRLIEFFLAVQNKSAQKTTKFIEKVVWKMGPFAALVGLVLIGFIFVGHIWFGPVNVRFSTEWQAFGTLFLWFVTLSGGQRDTFDKIPGGAFFIFSFIALAMILLLNMFMAVVMSAYDEINAEEAAETAHEIPKKPRQLLVADSLCDLFRVSQFHKDPYTPVEVVTAQLARSARLEGLRGVVTKTEHSAPGMMHLPRGPVAQPTSSVLVSQGFPQQAPPQTQGAPMIPSMVQGSPQHAPPQTYVQQSYPPQYYAAPMQSQGSVSQVYAPQGVPPGYAMQPQGSSTNRPYGQ